MIAVQERPRSRQYRLAQRIGARYEPRLAAAFLAAVATTQDTFDVAALIAALSAGKLTVAQLEAIAVGGLTLANAIGSSPGIESAIRGSIYAAGEATVDSLGNVLGFGLSFDAMDPNAVLIAREQVAQLVTYVSDDVKNAIRVVTALGQEQGLTVRRQARAVKQLVGLPHNWLSAPLNMGEAIRRGDEYTATSRRLSAADKAMIRKRIRDGTVTEDFIEDMEAIYTNRLRRARANTIARDATSEAANQGQRIGWQQMIDAGALPRDVRRVAIVVEDDRLRDTHAQIPVSNPNGVGMDEPFDTPFGPRMTPPWEPNCRCGVGLLLPDTREVL